MAVKKKYFKDEEINELFHEYLKMRKRIRKPATDYAIGLAIIKLRNLSGNDADMAKQILDKAIFNSNQGLWPVNNVVNDKNNGYERRSSYD